MKAEEKEENETTAIGSLVLKRSPSFDGHFMVKNNAEQPTQQCIDDG